MEDFLAFQPFFLHLLLDAPFDFLFDLFFLQLLLFLTQPMHFHIVIHGVVPLAIVWGVQIVHVIQYVHQLAVDPIRFANILADLPRDDTGRDCLGYHLVLGLRDQPDELVGVQFESAEDSDLVIDLAHEFSIHKLLKLLPLKEVRSQVIVFLLLS
jgi:hypothetical protein